MADEWTWSSSSARAGDEAACSTAEPTGESAVGSDPMGFSQPGLPDGAVAAVAASSSSSFLLADRHMDYWTQDFMGGRAPVAAEAAAAAASSFNTLLQLQGDAASHRLLLDDQSAAASPRAPSPSPHLVPSPYGDGATVAAPPPYEADSLRYCSFSSYAGGDTAAAAAASMSIPFSQLLARSSSAAAQQFPGAPGLFEQAATEPPQLLLQTLEPRFLKQPNADVCSPETTRGTAPAHEPTVKKARIEAPSPLPTFKVRKEKLGDRITALQQLVSPFGKTDTASVLHEAIEYIKFLHDQVASLSSPYLRCGRPMQQQHQQGSHKSKDNGEAKQDLRSRGLCLVPVASTYTVASETATEFWHPTFGGTFR
ncbi:transcription factor bHLH123-like [Oryza brachyantha]|uniref:transcription factor bHLH123-like n=1 Tax=Oryza brachyantha TaxID=4533 RepID=UPI0003EA8C0C|nr:transcription factor bHLH123-like [Oryza brachyantha]